MDGDGVNMIGAPLYKFTMNALDIDTMVSMILAWLLELLKARFSIFYLFISLFIIK